MKNTGVEAQEAFVEAMGTTGRWVYRFRDKKDVTGLNRGKRVAMFPCPADFMVGEAGRYILAEVKSTWDTARFSYGDIRPAQRSAASIAAKLKSPYFFFILDMNTGQWYVLTAAEFVEDVKAGKKSRTYKELTPCSLMSWSM